MATVAVGLSDTRVNAFLKDDKELLRRPRGRAEGREVGAVGACTAALMQHLRDQQAAIPPHGRAGGGWADPSHSACDPHFTHFLLFNQEKHPSISAVVPRAEQRVCAAAGQGLCPAKGQLCSCQDAVSSGSAGEMDGASAAVLVLDTEQGLARKKEIQTNTNCSVVLEVFYRNRDIF